MSVEVLGVLASIAFFARLTPQPIRLWRTGVPDGVSPMAAMNAALSDIGWILYGLAAGLVPVWLTAVVALVPGVWTVWLLRREATRRDLARHIALYSFMLLLGSMLLGTLVLRLFDLSVAALQALSWLWTELPLSCGQQWY